MKARLLKSSSLSDLYSQVASNLDRYRNGDFIFLQDDPSHYFEVDLTVDLKQLEKVLCRDDSSDEEILNCEHMFNAVPGITPYLARDERFWSYLTHTHLISYTRARWPIPPEDEKAVAHTQLHFFARGARGVERDNAASRLWWMAHLCARVEDIAMRGALQVFLFKADVRANIIERPSTSQNAVLFSAILTQLRESLIGDKALFDRPKFREFMKRINLQGGVRLLDSLDKDSIKELVLGSIP